jgi:vacuolar-type H+-ATPase subunit I/STV1
MNSVARKRRSEIQQMPTYNPNIQQSQSPPQQQQQSQSPQQSQQTKPIMGTGLTLPQVISVIDNRLINLENFMKETKSSDKSDIQQSQEQSEVPSEFIEEVQTRFDILAREISDLKDVILKLQSFTMDVNKSLLEERIHILSDIGENKNLGEVVEQDV